MKISHTALLGGAMALSLPLAVPAFAQTGGTNQQQMSQMNNVQWQGKDTIRGKVQNIDQSSSIVTVKTRHGHQLKLHYPSSALQKVKEGDNVAVQLAYAKTSGTSGATSTSQSSSGMQGSESMSGGNWQGVHTMPATVKEVDRKKGTVKVESEGKPLVVAFEPSALSQLKQGEKIKIHLAIRDTSSPTSSISR
ncbi:MAG TPA: hypothetical protein VFK24_02840 [Gammaproteobacteria bacterium]|nr:hypothetical protein [Gammaproteobacteria bacterium]